MDGMSIFIIFWSFMATLMFLGICVMAYEVLNMSPPIWIAGVLAVGVVGMLCALLVMYVEGYDIVKRGYEIQKLRQQNQIQNRP